MTPRFLVLNGARVLLLVLFLVFSDNRAIQAVCLGLLLATLVVDINLYRRQKAAEDLEDERHVPLPDRHRR